LAGRLLTKEWAKENSNTIASSAKHQTRSSSLHKMWTVAASAYCVGQCAIFALVIQDHLQVLEFKLSLQKDFLLSKHFFELSFNTSSQLINTSSQHY
jgi:hypothetical protein